VVTSIESDQEIILVCPACQHHIKISKDQFDNELTCPTNSCSLRLKINPFVIHKE